MSKRKLATVETILAIDPIEGADAIECATVRGWKVVVSKGEFTVGQKVIYFEIDSYLDTRSPYFAFLAARGTRKMNDPDDPSLSINYGHALKTIKLRGQISQGLVLDAAEFDMENEEDGTDVTDAFGVLKYEPYFNYSTGQRQISTFPTKYAQKSDAERVQNLGKVFDKLKAIPGWVSTVKLDGQSVTFFKDEEGTFRMASRNFEVDIDSDHPAAQWVKRTDLESLLFPGEAVQGEFCGPGIQGNKMGLETHNYYIFNVFQNGNHVPMNQWPESLFLYKIPVLRIEEFPNSIEEALSQASTIVYLNGYPAEGIVWHNDSEEVYKILGRYCWKAISDKFLLKDKG